MITNTKTLINDIRSLRGADVEIFGQNTVLPSAVDILTIDILDVLKALQEYEIDIEDEDYIDILDGYEYTEANNSYNWLAPVSNHFDYVVSNGLDGILVLFKVHRFGDVRGNYTDEVVLKFDNLYEFEEVLYDCIKYVPITVDGVEYSVEVNIFNDGYEIFAPYLDFTYHMCTAYGDMDDVIQAIRKNADAD